MFAVSGSFKTAAEAAAVPPIYFPGGISGYTIPAGSLKNEKGPSTDVRLEWATYYDAADQAGQSRLFGGIRGPVLRHVTAAYLALMLVYGLTNMANDLWTEQVVKRGWTSWQIPDVLHPEASAAWAAMLAVAALIYVASFRTRSGR